MLENHRLPIRNIVFATDFLESSRLALDYAVAFAHRYNSKLTIVHVFELSSQAEEVEMLSHRPSVSRELALARLEAFAAGVQRLGVNTEIDLREGEACAGVLSSAAENQAGLLVLGTHGIYRGLHHILVGSNAEKILLTAHCPTLTVGHHVLAGIDLDLQFKRILCISDFSPESVSAARYALSLGRDLGIPVELLEMAPENSPSKSVSQLPAVVQFCKELTGEPGLANHDWCTPDYHQDKVVSAEEIIGTAGGSVDSLLVLGVHSESRWNRHLYTSFAYQLVAKASSPLLSIHGYRIRTGAG